MRVVILLTLRSTSPGHNSCFVVLSWLSCCFRGSLQGRRLGSQHRPEGLRLHVLAAPFGLPIAFALTNPKTDERDVALDLFAADPALLAGRTIQTLMADNRYRSKEFDTGCEQNRTELIRPTMKNEPDRPGQRFLKPFRQIIESINQTLKAQLDLERHGGRSATGVTARVWQRMLALTAAIWHNQTTHQPVLRSLTAYDH